MIDWNYTFCFSIVSAALLLSALGLWFVAIIPGIDQWRKRFFLCYFIIFMLCCVFGLIEITLESILITGAMLYCVMIVEYLLLSVPLPMLTVYLLHCCGENTRTHKLLYSVLGLWAFYFVLFISSPFVDGFICFTPDNLYTRGSLYPLLLLPLIVILLLNLVGVIRRRMQLSRKSVLNFLIAILPMTVTMTVQLFIDVFPLIDISYVISAMSMYGLILSDQIEQDRRQQLKITRQQQEIARKKQEIARQEQEIVRQQLELAHERASVLVLQMRPHFIYNTLMSIYGLCNQDPQKARQVIMDFTNYLRKNFNAVASDKTIPFSVELEHTRAYLAVEQAQYEELLVVEYDTPFFYFRLPPLTLQPIAENAVKHGLDPYAGPLHISIRTEHIDSCSVITVEDNGPGLDPSEKIQPHTTLENIRQRLEMMCHGKLEILPRNGGGTTVRITIPDRNI